MKLTLIKIFCLYLLFESDLNAEGALPEYESTLTSSYIPFNNDFTPCNDPNRQVQIESEEFLNHKISVYRHGYSYDSIRGEIYHSNNPTPQGSGIMIGPYHFLTSAHTLFPAGELVKTLKIKIFKKGNIADKATISDNEQEIEAIGAFFYQDYLHEIKKHHKQYDHLDICLVILKDIVSPLVQETQGSIAAIDEDLLNQTSEEERKIKIVVLPLTHLPPEEKERCASLRGTLLKAQNKYVRSKISTTNSFSGGGLVLNDKYLIAIHKCTSADKDNTSFGIHISSLLLNNLLKWVNASLLINEVEPFKGTMNVHEKHPTLGRTILCYSPQNNWLAVAHDSVIELYRTISLKDLFRKFDLLELVSSLVFSPDEKWLVSGDTRGRILVWQCNQNGIDQPMLFSNKHREIRSIEFNRDGSYLAFGGFGGSCGGTYRSSDIYLYETKTFSLLPTLPTEPLPAPAAILTPECGKDILVIRSLFFTPASVHGSLRVFAHSNYSIQSWSSHPDNNMMCTIKKVGNSVLSFILHPGKALFVIGKDDGLVEIWDYSHEIIRNRSFDFKSAPVMLFRSNHPETNHFVVLTKKSIVFGEWGGRAINNTSEPKPQRNSRDVNNVSGLSFLHAGTTIVYLCMDKHFDRFSPIH